MWGFLQSKSVSVFVCCIFREKGRKNEKKRLTKREKFLIIELERF